MNDNNFGFGKLIFQVIFVISNSIINIYLTHDIISKSVINDEVSPI